MQNLVRLAALCLLAALCAIGQDTAEAHLGNGYEALRQDRYDEAAAEFRAALALDPKLTMRARFPLAVALFELKKPEEARREFEAVRREVGNHPNIAYYLGRLDLEDQHFAEAIRNFSQAIAKPPFPDTAYYLGFACFKQGDLAAAEKWLKQAVQINPQDNLAEYQLGRVYQKLGRAEEADKAFALSVEMRRRGTSESQLKLECEQKLDQGPREEALAICQRLYDPNHADKLTALGTIYGKHGELEAALGPLRRAAELEPQSPQTQYNLAFTYYKLKRFEDARAPLAKALARWPDLFPLNSLYGAVLAELGENTAAYPALRRAHQLNPQDGPTGELLYRTTLALARKSQAAREYSEALRYFGEAAELRPQDPEPHLGKAEVYRLTGQPSAADEEQRQAERLKR